MIRQSRTCRDLTLYNRARRMEYNLLIASIMKLHNLEPVAPDVRSLDEQPIDRAMTLICLNVKRAV